MEPPGHRRSMTSSVIWSENDFSNFWPLKIIHGHSKTIVACSTRRKEHAGRWNFALALSEAKLSAITGFRHFSALDLTSEVTGWPRTLSLYINVFVSRRATRSFFREPLAQSGAKPQRGSYQPPLVPWKDAKWPVPERVNTRTGGGGGKKCPPSGFSRIAEKGRRAAPPFFQYLLTIELDTLCKNFVD